MDAPKKFFGRPNKILVVKKNIGRPKKRETASLMAHTVNNQCTDKQKSPLDTPPEGQGEAAKKNQSKGESLTPPPAPTQEEGGADRSSDTPALSSGSADRRKDPLCGNRSCGINLVKANWT